MALQLPAKGASVDIICDWLELSAFLSEFNKSRVDEISAGAKTLEEEQPDDIAERDQEDDLLRLAIEQEIELRAANLQDAYPFELSRDGEELVLTAGIDTPQAALYLLCLIASHTAASPLLTKPPVDDVERRMRNRAFQVLGTLAIAGVATGSAVSVGWPRETKEAILVVLRRAEAWGIGLLPRDKPGRHANPHDKDGGIDAIGWSRDAKPPPRVIAFGQLASGNNWRDKAAKSDVHAFLNDFFDDHGTGNHIFVTVIPHRVADEMIFQSESQRHGHLAYRLSAPYHALRALRANAGGLPMDEAANFNQIAEWITGYREYARA